MTLLTGQIAQFVVPSDAIGNPNTTLIDWPNQRFYMFNAYGIRSYSTVFATQNPILSVATALNNTQACAVDASGALIVQSLAAYGLNAQPVFKISASTLSPGISFGGSTSYPSYPASVWLAQSIVCLTVNGVSYGLLKESAFSPNVAVFRTDTMTAAGAYIAASGGTDGRSFQCAGLNAGGTSATAFLLDQTLSGAYASVGVYKITVSAGAENYNIASWPAANPDINGGLLTTIAAASVDASWTSLTTNSLGYDAGSNFVLVDVTSGNTASVPRYLLALNPTSGAIMWRLGLPAGSFVMNLPQTRITATALPYLQYAASAAIYGIRTSDGQATINTVDGLYAGLPLPGMSSDDVSQIIISGVNPYTEATGTPTPVSGTPSSFTGWAMISVWPPFPAIPPPAAAPVGPSGPLGGWRGIVGINWLGMALVGDAYSGVVGLSDFTAFQEYGQTQRMLITSPPIHQDRKRVFIRRFELDIQAAVANASVPDPQLHLEWSKDSGRTWELLLVSRSMGQVGQYAKRLRWLNLGASRSWVLRVTVTDAVRRTIIGCYVDLAAGGR